MQLKYKLSFSASKAASAVATAAICLSVFAPTAFADNTVDISGNGAGSVNKVTIKTTSNCDVTQTNVSEISTEVYSSANTGGNKANQNTGGDVTIDTGNATSDVTVGVTGSTNTATNPCCGCSDPASNDLTISGNGVNSHNHIKVKKTGNTTLSQGNVSSIATGVSSKAKTGKNKANENTGGTVGVTTGDGTSTVHVTVGGSSNSL